jgi:hypothetical protein
MYVYQDKVSPPEKKLKYFEFDWKDKSVLELGANVGKLGLYVLGRGASKYKGIDWDKDVIALGKERYNLDLEAKNVLTWKDFDYDVTIAMALFHHFKDNQLEKLLSKINSKELIFEVPVGTNDVGLYQTRTEDEYENMINKLYGEVVEIVKSGATNDPYNDRVIFYCQKTFKPVKQRHEKVLIIGGGESLEGFNFEQTKGFDGVIITVNNVITHIPRADYWISIDLAKSLEGLETTFEDCYYYAGYPIFDSPYKNRKDIHFLEKIIPEEDFSLQEDKSKITGDVDSIYSALNLAYHFEAKKICLLGIDCYGYGHWYDKGSPYNAYNQANFGNHLNRLPIRYKQSVEQFNKRDCLVVNGSPKSRIDCFPRMTAQEAYNLIK